MKTSAILFYLLLCFSYLGNSKENFPQADGANGNWIIQSQLSAPTNWSVRNGKNIKWKTTLPEGGQSGIIINNGRIFLSVMKPIEKVLNKQNLRNSDILCLCLDEESGRVLWQKELQGSLKSEMMSGFSDSSSPSPVSDGTNVWFFNASGSLACYDFEGNLKWQRQWKPVEELNGIKFPFNKQFEPILHGDLIINMEPATEKHSGKNKGWNYLFALNKNTGAPVWISEDSLTHYNTPCIGQLTEGKNTVLIGRGGHHRVPEKPRGYSMIDLDTGKRIWKYEAKSGMALYNSAFNDKYAVWMTYNNEIHLLKPQSGKFIKKISLSDKVDYHRFDKEKQKHVTETDINFKSKYGKNIFPAWFSNLIFDDQLFFMCFKAGAYNKKVGPDYCMARVNLSSGLVEYLEVPANFTFEGNQKKYIWNQDLKTTTINSRGLDVSYDKRSRRDGWHWNFNGNPIVVNDTIYFTIMSGLCYCLNTKAKNWDSSALINLNDLGPFRKTWSVNTPSFANGKLYHRTLKELISISNIK